MARADLKPVRSEAEAKAKGAKGGRASGAARRARRDLREHMRALLDGDRDGITGAEALSLAMFEKALVGDVKAFEAVLACAGQAPRQTLPPFNLPDIESAQGLPKLTAGILTAVSTGTLTPEEGTKLANVAALHVKALELSDIERRISALEAKQQ